MILLILVAALSVSDTQVFDDVQCQLFRNAIYDHLIAANAGDKEAQQIISLYEAGCTNREWAAYDDPMPGHVLRPIHPEVDE